MSHQTGAMILKHKLIGHMTDLVSSFGHPVSEHPSLLGRSSTEHVSAEHGQPPPPSSTGGQVTSPLSPRV